MEFYSPRHFIGGSDGGAPTTSFRQIEANRRSARKSAGRSNYGRRQAALPLQCGPPRPDRRDGDWCALGREGAPSGIRFAIDDA